MKKAFLVVTAVLLALVVVSCDNFVKPADGEKPQVYYDKDGRASIDLTVGLNVGNARALHDTLAQAGSDFFEVIFVSSTGRVSRTNWRDGLKVAKLRIDLGATPATGIDYDNSGSAGKGYAYIFAGRYSDKTLLGVGKISRVEQSDGSDNGTVIDTDSMKVYFEVTALESDVNVYLPTSAPGTPKSFAIDPPADFSVTDLYIDEIPFTVYQIKVNATTNATFNLTNITNIQTLGLDDAIMVAGAFAGGYKPYIAPEDDIKPVGLDNFTATVTAGSKLAWPIPLAITAGPDEYNGEPGLCLIYIDIPVYLYNNLAITNANFVAGLPPVTWHFKGGLNNKMLDMGHNDMSLGGAIVICVGDLDGGPNSKEIIVGGWATP